MKVTFWGVRGSIPCPGPDTVRYGGNTACVEIYIEQIDRRFIVDAGSGIRVLGNELAARFAPKGGVCADLFITHTHWDHILGFPFFAPLYLANTQLRIYGPMTHEEVTLEEVLGGQLTYRYFPVRHEELLASITYTHLKEGCYELGQGVKVTTKYLNHPLLCLGYRFEYADKVVCTAFDTEPFTNYFALNPHDDNFDEAMAAEGAAAAAEQNALIEDFIRNADLLIYDAQYTQAEYDEAKIGWGHSSIEHAIKISKRNNVKNLALFHHEVQRADAQIDRLQSDHCRSVQGTQTRLFFAKEGSSIDV